MHDHTEVANSNAMKVTAWREVRRGATLQGFFAIELRSGLKIFDIAFHKRPDGQKWLGLPSRSYEKDGGGTAWSPLIGFISKAVQEKFTIAALAALDMFFQANPDQDPAKEKRAAKPVMQEDLDPF